MYISIYLFILSYWVSILQLYCHDYHILGKILGDFLFFQFHFQLIQYQIPRNINSQNSTPYLQKYYVM